MSTDAALVSDTSRLDLVRFRRKEHLSVLAPEPWGPTYIASDSFIVALENGCITTGTLVQYRVEFGVEHLLFSFTHLGRSINCNNRHEA